MSRFSSKWLHLREPIDATSRNPELTRQLITWRRRYNILSILDLGSGTGANVRFLAPALSGGQRWRLVDRDSGLVEHSQMDLYRWATKRDMRVTDKDALMILEDETDRYQLEWLCLDLNHDWAQLATPNARLVTASALIDLTSAEWLECLAKRCREWRAAVFIALSYDGNIAWEPMTQRDEWLRTGINRHQRTDKGFGPALGPDAAPMLASQLEKLGYRVDLRPSPWKLEAWDITMQRALLDEWMDANRHIALEPTSWLDDWLHERHELIERGLSRLSVGHWDLFAYLE